uniref:DUF4407 domain-containing protein n=1 Tax=Candidatus Kentrum sp. MB TaxID=2138164 RepID=A0A451BGN5_9GAMM|nr:MAG: protein of unknown function (DUF4407) [Candidatus Kentron sp. MB]VFK35687.1 MAG: protein of unknown function (DUF4407) [Candidatus Kentron sp. MB]VFK77436.1 MAG: protein of unknown function (DUF4407) [Candidatus Kentron sp. MB]
METLRRFLFFCSGTDRVIIEDCHRHDQLIKSAIGATVLLTSFLAILSGGYALHTVFRDISVAIPLGILWGLLIFNLDRFIVMSITQRGVYRFFMFIARLILAGLIAIVVIRPLELRLFSPEIENHLQREKAAEIERIHYLAEQQQEKYHRQYTKDLKARQERYGIDSLKQDKGKYREDLLACRKRLRELEDRYLNECAGEAGTMLRGDGPECRRTYIAKLDKSWTNDHVVGSSTPDNEKASAVS